MIAIVHRCLSGEMPMNYQFARFLIIISLFSGHVWSMGEEGSVDPRIHSVEFGLLPITSTKEHMGATVGIVQRMRDFGTPGLSVAVIEGGRLAWAHGYGVADSKSHRPVTAETLFQAASISKPLTAMGVLALVQSGKLNLDQDVNQYLKSWKVPENQFTQTHKVTLRLLLSHTAGVADIDFPDSGPNDPLPTLVQILNGAPPAKNKPITIDAVPGGHHLYSRGGYDITQQLLMDLSAEPFEDCMQTVVLHPLGMTHSSFRQPLPPSLLRIAATPHLAGGARILEEFRTPEMAMAGLWSTPSDLTRFLISIQRTLSGSNDGLIGSQLTKEMLTPQKGFHGLGPVISGEGETVRFGHDGFNEGFISSMVGYEKFGQGAVVMANSGFSFMLIKEVLDSIARAYQWRNYDFTNMRPPDASLPQQEVIEVPQELIMASVGQYRLDDEDTFRIFEKKQHLFIDWPGEGEAEIFTTPSGRMFCASLPFGSPWLTFVRANKGTKIVTKILAAHDGSQAFVRVN
jgi:CubicO group peptidase (beta-lactamase class C family)